MKKILLACAVSAMFAGTAEASWGVIGGFTGWSEDVEMTDNGDGTFSVTISSIEGEFKFREDHAWENNLGSVNVSEISGNATVRVAKNGSNFSTAGVLENVTFTIDPEARTLAISGLPSDMDVPPITENPKGCFLIGEIAPEGWSASVGIPMEEVEENVYSAIFALPEMCYFSFTTEMSAIGDWDVTNSHRFGAVDKSDAAVDGRPYLRDGSFELELDPDGCWVTEYAGNYEITIDVAKMTMTVRDVTYVANWGLCGDYNSWGEIPDTAMKYEGNAIYTVTMTDFGGEFKFRADNGWEMNFGALWDSTPVIAANGRYAVESGGQNFKIENTVSTITFTLNLKDRTLMVSDCPELGSESVGALGADTDAPVFFNLQGSRVENPENGIFIKVCAGKAEKVVR